LLFFSNKTLFNLPINRGSFFKLINSEPFMIQLTLRSFSQMSFSDSIGRKVELDVFCPTELMETLIWNKFQLN
jgi:hypothetical protein